MTLDTLAVAHAQQVVITCGAYLGGAPIASLSICGGSITADARRSKLRDGTIQLSPDADRSSLDLYLLLCTPGLELVVSRGFVLADGTTVMAAVGRFVVDEPTYHRAPGAVTVSATVSDLSERVSRNRWTDPYQVAAGTLLADAVNTILLNRWNGVTSGIDSALVPDTLGAAAVFATGDQSDPWADACGLATALGYSLSFDTSGVAQLIPAPDLMMTSPVFAFARGAAAIITEQDRVSLVDLQRNGVIATAEGSDVAVPLRGEAWDENPASPTFRYGPFGQAPMFYSSPLMTTQAQCDLAAATQLAACLGRSEQLTWSQVTHPGLEPLDVVTVELEDGSVNTYILDCLTIPLTVTDAMSAIARNVVVNY